MDFLLAAVGLALLFASGDYLVRGAVAAGLRLNIPAIVIGLTVVAFGTSAPELVVTVQASLEGAAGIAVGNVVGSNIANVLLVLGLPALLKPFGDHSPETRRNYVIMIGATIVTMALCHGGKLIWWQGALLLSLLGLFLLDTYRAALAARAKGACEPCCDEIAEAETDAAPWRIAAMIAAGVIGLPIAAHLTVESSLAIAGAYGLSDEAIGLTLVAVGTSLPELATTVMAARRGRADLAIGNVIGSNVFNLLCILGVAATMGDVAVPEEFLTVNLWVMLASAVALAPYVLTRRPVCRITGGLFIAAYAVYVGAVMAAV